MALDQSALTDLLDALRAGGDLDFMREAMQLVLQALIDLEATAVIGAERYERSESRTTLRNGNFFPALLEPRRRIDRALWAVVMEAYVHGVSTRKVDDLVAALGSDSGISKSEVSRIGGEVDGVVATFRDRPLGHTAFPYVFLDATYVKAHDGASVVSKAIVVATGVTKTGDSEVLGLAVGASEDGAFWTAFLRSLRARGLSGVRLVISDAHEGLKAAIGAVVLGAGWQRCRVHFLRNVLARIPKGSAEMVLAAIRTIFAQPDAAAVAEQLDEIAAKLVEAREDVLAFTAFPLGHWRKIWSTNPLERVNKEIKRRTDVVGIFPNEAAVMRLAGAVLLEIPDEWAIAERRYLSEGSMARLDPARDDELTKEVERAKTVLLAS